MISDKRKICLRKCISFLIYLFGLIAQIYSLFIYYNSDLYLANKPFRITLCAFLVVYLLFGIVLVFRLFNNKSNPIMIIFILFIAFLLSFPFTNKFQPQKDVELYDYNQINYLLRNDTDGIRGHRDAEVFFYNYLADKNVYVSKENYIFSVAYKANKYVLYNAYKYNLITDTNLDLTLSDELATNIASNSDYYNFICEFLYRSAECMEVFAYVGEDFNDCKDVMVCSDSKGYIYFIPKHKWEEIK